MTTLLGTAAIVTGAPRGIGAAPRASYITGASLTVDATNA
jgi:hypothetical protein